MVEPFRDLKQRLNGDAFVMGRNRSRGSPYSI